MIKMPDCGLYAITDSGNHTVTSLLEKTEKILAAGTGVLQFRDKSRTTSEKKKVALELSLLCKKYDTVFIINDDITLAKEVNADGIHLGERDKTIKAARKLAGDLILGKSCYNNLDLALAAENDGADYVAFGSFFPSKTKPDAREASLDLISIAKSKIKIPIVAIGGITPENGRVLIDAGAEFLAVISGLFDAPDITKVTKKYLELFNNSNNYDQKIV